MCIGCDSNSRIQHDGSNYHSDSEDTMITRLLIGFSFAMLCAVPGYAADPSVASNSASKEPSGSSMTLNEQDHALAQAQEVGEYRIGPEDVLDISVWNNSAISRTVPVRPDGKISLPLVNDAQAPGLAHTQLQ